VLLPVLLGKSYILTKDDNIALVPGDEYNKPPSSRKRKREVTCCHRLYQAEVEKNKKLRQEVERMQGIVHQLTFNTLTKTK
jgi:hypothetical protein